MELCYWFDLILGRIFFFFFCGFMVVELGVALVWFDFDFVGGRSLWLGFLGFQENNSLGMFFVAVVAVGAGG